MSVSQYPVSVLAFHTRDTEIGEALNTREQRGTVKGIRETSNGSIIHSVSTITAEEELILFCHHWKDRSRG